MPADAGIDDGRTGRFDGLGQSHNLLPVAAALDQIEHRQAEDDDEVRANFRACGLDRLDGKADSVLERTTPLVGALVGLRRYELVDQVAFGAHDLYPVVASLLRQTCAACVVAYGLADAPLRQRTRCKAVDRRTQL